MHAVFVTVVVVSSNLIKNASVAGGCPCSNNDTFQGTNSFQRMSRDLKLCQSTCLGVAHCFTLRFKPRWGIFHPDFTKVFKKPRHDPPMHRGARLGPSRRACVEPLYSAERPQTTYTIPSSGGAWKTGPRSCLVSHSAVAVSAPGWIRPSRIPMRTRSGRYLLLRKASCFCRLCPRLSSMNSTNQHKTLSNWLIHSCQRALKR